VVGLGARSGSGLGRGGAGPRSLARGPPSLAGSLVPPKGRTAVRTLSVYGSVVVGVVVGGGGSVVGGTVVVVVSSMWVVVVVSGSGLGFL